MDIRKIKVEEMQVAEYNPRKDLTTEDEEYQHIKNSVDDFGYIQPIVYNERTHRIIGGHQRFKVLVAAGETEIECVVVNFDERREKACNLALNKAQGVWDMEKLEVVLLELKEIGLEMEQYGFEDVSFPEELALDRDENGTKNQSQYLQFCGKRVIMTEVEAGRMLVIYNNYLNSNGNLFGFATVLMDGGAGEYEN